MDLAETTQRRPAVRRVTTEVADTAHAAAFSKHVLEEAYAVAGNWEPLETSAVRQESRLGTVAERTALLDEHRQAFLRSPQRLLDVGIPWGVSIAAAPYDTDWAVGGGAPFARLDGGLFTIGVDGESACGVGMFLHAESSGLALVRPAGDYDFNWVSFESYPTLRSTGGLGMAAYDSATSSLLVSKRAQLWSVTSPAQWAAGSGTGAVADAATPPHAGSFGPVPISPLLFPVSAGRTYLVWIWAWQVMRHGLESPAFLALLKARVPLLLVDVGAGPVVR